MTNAALIVAAGRGSRMMQETPKQYLSLGGKTVLWHTVNAFLTSQEINQICVVIHRDDQTLYNQAVAEIRDPRLMTPIYGGATRAASVRLGLEALQYHCPKHVLIHDAARPFCPSELISAVIAPLDDVEGTFAALPVVDALWKTEGIEALAPVPRAGLWRAQTPQAFRYQDILRAHLTGDASATDDVETAREAGLRVHVVKGAEENFKITLPCDLERAERILADKMR